jgi:hypothetical protein
MPKVKGYDGAYYSMTWLGPKGYPEDANAGRCYFTGTLGMLRFFGEEDVLFADGTGGDGFSFRWCPKWGAPAFNGGKGTFHEIWEYTPKALGFEGHWEQDDENGWEGAWEKLRGAGGPRHSGAGRPALQPAPAVRSSGRVSAP